MAMYCKRGCHLCEDFASDIPSSVNHPITIHRATEREVMPFRQGMCVSSYMNDFIPPSLLPGYMGHVPKISSGQITFGGATKHYFQNMRQEILTKSTQPKFVYGRLLPTELCPLPDVAHAERVIQYGKLSDIASIRPISYDAKRFCEIQKYYEDAQAHRDYYLDKTDEIYPVRRFNLGIPYPTQCPVDERVFKIRKPHGICDEPGYLGPMPYYNCRKLPCIYHQDLLTPFNFPKLPRPPFLPCHMKPKSADKYETLMI